MEITLIKSPDTLQERIKVQWYQLSPETVEALIAELYQADCITFRQTQHLLNCTTWQETAAILERHGCQLYYDRDDFEEDLHVLGLSQKTKIS